MLPHLTLRRSQNLAHGELGMVLATILDKYDLYRSQEGRTLEFYDNIRGRDMVANSEMVTPMRARQGKSWASR